MSSDLQLAQIALSCADLHATSVWYRDCFGYLSAIGSFESEAYSGPVDLAVMTGVADPAVHVRWLLDQQDFFQLELFEYRHPHARPLPTGWRPCDIGYTIIGLHVTDFDATLRRLGACGTHPLGPTLGQLGQRRACIRDPNGVVLELMEDDPRVPDTPPRLRAEVPVVTRFVRASVPDLERALAYFVDTVGMRRHMALLHTPDHERMWGLEGARARVELLSAGDFWLELASYDEPQPAPWPADYRISDLGILNIALGTRDREAFRTTQQAVVAGGYHANPSNDVGFGEFVYTMDDQGFSVEFMYLDREADAMAGFAPDLANPSGAVGRR
jgi:catechol 2,3-dioxygenase-like lactoylglutathione lyase family enzyme